MIMHLSLWGSNLLINFRTPEYKKIAQCICIWIYIQKGKKRPISTFCTIQKTYDSGLNPNKMKRNGLSFLLCFMTNCHENLSESFLFPWPQSKLWNILLVCTFIQVFLLICDNFCMIWVIAASNSRIYNK